MQNQRLFLWAALLFVCFLIYQAWTQDHAPTPAPSQPVAEQSAAGQQEAPAGTADSTPASASVQGDVPAAAPVNDTHAKQAATADTTPAKVPAAVTAPNVHVRTDVLDLEISTVGGTITRSRLLSYQHKTDEPVLVLRHDDDQLFLAQGGLRGLDGSTAPDHRATYRVARKDYALGPDADSLSVTLTWKQNGIQVNKVFTFHRGKYQVDVDYKLVNSGSATWHGDAYMQLTRRHHKQEHSMFNPQSRFFDGPAYFFNDKYEKVDFEDVGGLNKEAFAKPVTGGWAGIMHYYFLAALIPPQDAKLRYYTRTGTDNVYSIGAVQPSATVEPGASTDFHQRLYIGPKLQDRLAEVAPGLERSVDYGMLTILSEPLFWLLEKIHSILGNWGWSIVLLTLLIKAVFYKLSETSGRSMAKMKRITPRIQALKERYKDDRQRMNMAMMQLYKEEKVNPAAGCFPILVQMPVFIALYWVLLYSVELWQAPWILWIHDLSAHDPYYVLPVLVGMAMFAQQKLNPTPAEPMQQKIQMVMPLALIAFYAVMPAGLVIYWFFNTLLSVLQQWQINRVVEREAAAKRR